MRRLRFAPVACFRRVVFNLFASLPSGWTLTALLVAGTLAGCSSGDSPPVAAPPQSPSTTKSPASTPRAIAASPEETWDVCFIQDSRIGYVHARIEPVEQEGRSLVRTTATNELTFKRFGQLSTQRMTLVSLETADGELLRFSSRVTAGREETVAEGECQGAKVVLKTTTPGKSDVSQLAWDKSYGGFFASEYSLRRSPMRPGETRTLKALLPVVNQIGVVTLQAADYEATPFLGQTRELLKIRKVDEIGATKIESTLWADRDGDVLKSRIPSLGLEAFRTTQAEATRTDGPMNYDLGESSVVAVRQSLPNPHGTRQVRYKATLRESSPDTLFENGASQSVRKIDDRTVEIVVQAVRPGQPSELTAAEREPTADDLASNNFVQCDAPKIVAMAAEAAGDETDPWKTACAAERFVQQKIRKKNFSQALATAAEVAESLEGDCTEHSVLLAALCRARKIPARVAVGLVYYRPAGGFAYHMWNEVWIGDRWIPLDATLGLGGIGGAHLKLSSSSLKSSDAFSPFLPVANVIGQLAIEIVDVARSASP